MSALRSLTLLIAEDEKLLRQALLDVLAPHCGKILLGTNGEEAFDIFMSEKPDLVLTDIIMPKMDGIALTEKIRSFSPETPIIFYSAFSEVQYLLRGIELGVAGFVPKPCPEKKLIATLEKAALPVSQKQQLLGLRTELQQSVEQMLGRGPRMKEVAAQVCRIARSDYAILLQGETGSGKSRLAAMIHDLSSRADKPFVAVQLGAMPSTLVAAELFGHEKGAFTGAERKRDGLVKAADGGTLFLDDIDTAPLQVQAMLLQLVEQGYYNLLGSTRRLQANIRIITASNQNLKELAASGRFRQDLYYRLATFFIDMPPLRSIPEDIGVLANKFLVEACQEMGRPLLEMGADALAALQAHSWPGNIRELRNIIKRAAVMADNRIDKQIIATVLGVPEQRQLPNDTCMTGSDAPDSLPLDLDEVEKWAFTRALQAAEGKKMVAARLLGLNYNTFQRRLKRHGMMLDTD